MDDVGIKHSVVFFVFISPAFPSLIYELRVSAPDSMRFQFTCSVSNESPNKLKNNKLWVLYTVGFILTGLGNYFQSEKNQLQAQLFGQYSGLPRLSLQIQILF